MANEYLLEGRAKAFWVNTLSSTTAPSAAQINAGTAITGKLRSVPSVDRDVNIADTSDLTSLNDTGIRGTTPLSRLKLGMKRALGTETEWASMSEAEDGYLVVFYKGTAGANPAAGDKCSVYTCQVLVKRHVVPARGEIHNGEIEMVQTADPQEDVTCAA